MASYKPPKGVMEAAEAALRVRKEKPSSQRGMGPVGLARARDLSNGKPVSEETLRRMVSFLKRHAVNKEASSWSDKGPGWQAYQGWGGDAGLRWAEGILKDLEREEGDSKHKGASTPAPPKDRISGSKRNPKGTAENTRGGIEISEAAEKSLKNKVKEHNDKYGDDPAKKIDLGMLKAVYRRGAGAYSTSHRPGTTRGQWAMARVNSFITLMRRGKPDNSKYITDNDLLPKEHPRSSKREKKVKKSDAPSCPLATQDLELNTRNRNKAIKEDYISYGPINLSDEEYWVKLADHWDTDVESAKESNCSNCAAFDISPSMQECMPGEVQDEEGRLGYCHMHSFKCHSARTCYTWAAGGPITDDEVSESWSGEEGGEDMEEVINADLDNSQKVYRVDYFGFDMAKAVTTRDGFLEIKDAVVARAGVLDYRMSDGSTYRELRDPEVLFAGNALDSYNGRPLLEGSHPMDPVTGKPTFITADNVGNWPPVGSVRNLRSGLANNPDKPSEMIQVTRADIVIWGRTDSSGKNTTIDRIKSGELREFSVGYETMLDPTPGVFDGQPYDARQVSDVGNHIALVAKGRAGEVTKFRMDSVKNPLTFGLRFDTALSSAHNKAEVCLEEGTQPNTAEVKKMAKITLRDVHGDVAECLIPIIQDMKKEAKAAEKQISNLEGALKETRAKAEEYHARADSLAKEVSDKEALVEKANEETAESKTAIEAVRADSESQVAALNEELGAEKAKLGAAEARIAELEASLAEASKRADSAPDVDALIQGRLELIEDSRQYLPSDYSWVGKSDLQIKADAVAFVTKREDIDEKQVEGAYKVLSLIAEKKQDNTDAVSASTRPASQKVAPFRMTADSKPTITADEARKQFLSNHRTDHGTGRNGFAG